MKLEKIFQFSLSVHFVNLMIFETSTLFYSQICFIKNDLNFSVPY
jgi:hypothetical protein